MPTNLPKMVAALARAGRLAVLISLRQPPHAPRRLDHGRSVPLPVALARRLCVRSARHAVQPQRAPLHLVCVEKQPPFLKEQGSSFRVFCVKILTFANIFRLHNKATDATPRK
jgi:hypothetical protein